MWWVGLLLGSVAGAAACNGTMAGTPDASSSAVCGTLATCCLSLSEAAAQKACSTVVSEGTASGCTNALLTYTSAGQCGATTGPASTETCAGLATCCAKMTGPAQLACNEIVSAGVGATCVNDLNTYTSADLCRPEMSAFVDSGLSLDSGAAGGDASHSTSSGDGSSGGVFDAGLHDATQGGQKDVTIPEDTGTRTDAAHTEDTGTKADAGHKDDTCGTCGTDCKDSCGNACTGGQCAAMCTASCLTNEDCESSCPATSGHASCCDLGANACFVADGTCPSTSNDAGTGDSGMY
jgi:hypothetical protein